MTSTTAKSILELRVNNHPGVMSHICGLFARRAYNVEGIICTPIADTIYSRVLLLVNEDGRLEQITSQTRKLVDVLSIQRHDTGQSMFNLLERLFRA
jgi:acetolactate synthase-1/3 small subunit